ncbi:Rpp14/Pop5 family protein [[Eubacterium] cellulosolvens]
MVVKSKIGRRRYIVFKIDSASLISKRDLIYTLNKLLHYNANNNLQNETSKENITYHPSKDTASVPQQIAFNQLPWIIYLVNNYGLIRCHHLDQNKTISLLNSIKWIGKKKSPINIRTLGTTGTIRKARKKYLDKLNLYPLNIPKNK